MYAEAKGSTLIKETHSGDRFRIAGDAGSQSARATMLTLALGYAFQALSQAVRSVIRHGY
jgi:plasminogen activator